MMKWLRTHTKKIMVVVVLIAMFSFVGGPALYDLLAPDPLADPAANAFGKVFVDGDLMPYHQDTEVLEKLGISWQYVGRGGEILPHHWFLLAKEAENAGIMVSQQEVEDSIQSIQREAETRQPGINIIEAMRTNFHNSPAQVRRALASALLIRKNFNRIRDACQPSETQVQQFVHDTEDKVQVRFVALEAEKFTEPNEAVSDAEAQAQFDRWKNVLPAESEAGFGYKHPRRVVVQYIVADLAEIQAQLPISFDEVKEYWKANRAKYRKVDFVDEPAASQPTSMPSASSQANATQPAASQPAPIKKRVEREKTFSEARPDIERELRERHALRASELAMRKIAELAGEPWTAVKPVEETGYKPIPEGVKDPKYLENLFQKVARDAGLALMYGETGLVTMEDLNANKILGGVRTGGGEDPMSMSRSPDQLDVGELAFRVPAFYTKSGGRDTVAALQLYQTPGLPLKAMNYSFASGRIEQKPSRLAIFRVIAARESEPPTKLEEVKDKVIADVRKARAFERLGALAKEYHAVAGRLGVEAALARFQDIQTKQDIKNSTVAPEFARRMMENLPRNPENPDEGGVRLVAPSVSGVGDSLEFADACFEMARDGWAPPAVDAPQTERTMAATTMPAPASEPKVVLVALPKLHKYCVVELLTKHPVEDVKYESQSRKPVYQTLMGDRAGAVAMEWFSPKDIERRCSYEPIERKRPMNYSDGVREKAPPIAY